MLKSAGAWLCLGALTVTLAACGSSNKSSTSTPQPTPSATPASGTPTGDGWAKSFLSQAYAGTDSSLPTSSPQPTKNMTVWILSCSQSAPGCAVPAQAAAAAAATIGWKAKILDGKFDPTVWNTLVRSAAAAKPNALILDAVDCAPVQASLAAAKQAGVKIYGFYSFDCDDTYTKGRPMFDGQLAFSPWKNYADFVENQFAKTQAAWTLTHAGNDPKVIQFYETDVAVAHHIGDGYDRWMASCKNCSVWKVPFTGADLISGKLQAKAAAALSKYPTANVVAAPYDATVLLGIGPAVASARASGRKLLLTGGEGLAPNIALIRKHVQDAAAGVPAAWVGWAAIDGVNRMLHGQAQVPEGLGNQAIDSSHNLPTKTPYYDGNAKSQDYQSVYKKLWGIAG